MKYSVSEEEIICLHNTRYYLAKALLDGRGESSELVRQHLVEALSYLNPTAVRLHDELQKDKKNLTSEM